MHYEHSYSSVLLSLSHFLPLSSLSHWSAHLDGPRCHVVIMPDVTRQNTTGIQAYMANYLSKHHDEKHHNKVRATYLYIKNPPRTLQKAPTPCDLRGCIGKQVGGWEGAYPCPLFLWSAHILVQPTCDIMVLAASHRSLTFFCYQLNHVHNFGRILI